MEKKYELLNDGVLSDDLVNYTIVKRHTLHRIKALRDFGDVKAGDLGGWIEKEENLSHEGNAWVYDTAQVFDNAMVYGNAKVYDNAWVYGNAMVYDNAMVFGNAKVYSNAWVYGNARVYDNATVSCYAQIHDNAEVSDNVVVYGNNTEICGNAILYNDVELDVLGVKLSEDAYIGSRKDYVSSNNIGLAAYGIKILAFKCKDGNVRLQCDGFYGTLDEFKSKVKISYYNDNVFNRVNLKSAGILVNVLTKWKGLAGSYN